MYRIILIFVIFIMSCSSSEKIIHSDIEGIWINQLQSAGEIGSDRKYYQFIFTKDSFNIEIGELNADTDLSYEPFRAKGLYKIRGDIINMKGVAKAEGFTKYNVNFEEKFEYAFDENTIVLFPQGNIVSNRFYLIRRF
ncbi:MAG TPA: hypothetical protein PK294_03035 [Ignavibacteria bacterium]|nr:hypothetical protein [Ignavibacteria bacterium]HQY51746.1 hypothetical protein [Ignavibacteria bacterium]HRA99391.1 hypothetical protein [Ignavibacteria bacterium]